MSIITDAITEVKIGADYRCKIPSVVVDKLLLRVGEEIRVTLYDVHEVSFKVRVGHNFRFTIPKDVVAQLNLQEKDIIRMKIERV